MAAGGGERARAALRASGAAARRVGRAGRRAGRAVRRTTHASGAGRTGLGGLIELCALNSAADAFVAVALANTLFFGVPVGEARGRVALYLLLSMAPFAIVAPFVGPALDRLRHGRRFMLAGTMLARGLLCWTMAVAVVHDDALGLLPSAFGVLVLSKAFGVTRSAITPRVLPAEITLVTANARCSLAGLTGAALAAPVAAGLGQITEPAWVLRVGLLLFGAGVLLSLRLPAHVESAEAEEETTLGAQPYEGPAGAGPSGTAPTRSLPRRRWRTFVEVGPVVGEALRATAVLRAFSGFVVLYLAFLLRTHDFGISAVVALGALVAAAGIGGIAGTAAGALTNARAPHLVIFATFAVSVVATALGAAFFGLAAALAVAFVAAAGQALGKLALDSIVQREIGEEIRSSAFAVTETLNQVVWVAGGLIGLLVSLAAQGRTGFAVAAAALAAVLALLLVQRRRRAARSRRRTRTPPGKPQRADVRH